MKYKGYDILKIVAKKREVSFNELLNTIPQRYKDHRDWYELAGLCMEGYIATTLRTTMNDAFEYAQLFQAYYQKGAYGSIHLKQPNLNDNHFFILAKGDLYFQSLREKRMDRWYGVIIAIVVGIVVGVTATYLSNNYFQ